MASSFDKPSSSNASEGRTDSIRFILHPEESHGRKEYLLSYTPNTAIKTFPLEVAMYESLQQHPTVRSSCLNTSNFLVTKTYGCSSGRQMSLRPQK
jgi:hypothetical protein